MDKKYADYTSVVVLVFGILWFCQDLVVHGEVPFYRDLTNYFYPLLHHLQESFKAGELPLWDRRFAQGFPNLAAFQIGAFYPPNLTLTFLPFYTAIQVLFVFHFLIAAIGTYGLLRRWKYPCDLAVVGALLFALGGIVVSLSNLMNHFQSAVWLPLLILGWERALLIPRWSSFLRFTIIAALQFLAGSPELFALSMGLALLDGIRLHNCAPAVSWFRVIGLATAGNLLMLTLIMAQLLPTAELILESRRGQSIPAAEALMWSLNPANLLNLFFLDREVDLSFGGGVRFFFSRRTPLFLSYYLGAISLLGMALWAYYGSRREKLLLLALTLASLAMALGDQALVYPFLLQYLPLVSAIRFPEKFFFLTYVLVFLMTMRGLKGFLLDKEGSARTPVLVLVTMALAWMVLYGILAFRSEIVSDFIAANSSIAPLSELHTRAAVSVLANLQRQVILTVAFVVLMILSRAEKIRPLVFSILFVAVVYVDLAWAHRSFLFPIEPGRVNRDSPVVPPNETYLTRFFYYPSSRDLHPAFFSVLGHPNFEQSLALSFQNYLPNVGVASGIDYLQEIDALGRRSYNEFLKFANNLPLKNQVQLLGTFNVKHLVSFRELPQTGIRLVARFPKYFSWLYQIDGTVPRTYMVGRAIVEREPQKVLERLANLTFDARKAVILDTHVPLSSPPSIVAAVRIERYENQYVTIRATTNEDGILVLADSFYPGWKAFVDGKETTILRANHFYRAVVVSKGDHKIDFKYEPMSFKVGVFISLFTLVSLTVVSAGVFIRHHRMAVNPPISAYEIL